MKLTEIQFCGLVALRALAEFDPIEFRRVTDMSRRDLDTKIRKLQSDNVESEGFRYYKQILGLLETSHNEQANQFPMRQIYMGCNAIAQYNSLTERRIEAAVDVELNENVKVYASVGLRIAAQGDELLRLSVMRLLRILRSYRPSFHNKVGRHYVDCLLEPVDQQLPFVIIETKRLSSDSGKNKTAWEDLNQSMTIYGHDTLGIIVTDSRLGQSIIETPNKIFVLEYSLNNNEFVGRGIVELLSWFDKNTPL